MTLLITFIALWIAALVLVIYAAIRLLKLAKRLENQMTDDPEPESTEENIQKEFGVMPEVNQHMYSGEISKEEFFKVAEECMKGSDENLQRNHEEAEKLLITHLAGGE
ncbi:MAG TPA: hypothetical protein DIS74_09770 [Bacteroidales bacterium]|nr:hypothetical protein [Bacteroidales bacterium]